MRYIILGTAGHIDHGKSSLVKALTGTDPDRLKEEKERGITIDLGFASMSYPDGLSIGIVDVPGHERLIKNMLAGAGGIDLVLLVIAADEGVMPQSREHLAICNLLKIKKGLIAITKSDLVEEDWIELVSDDIRNLVKGTFLEGADIVPVSSVTGQNIDHLNEKIRGAASGIEPKPWKGVFRLPVDRVFTMKGFGTVITGTAVSGSISVDDPLEILPEGIRTKVRGLQSHGSSLKTAYAGQRVSVNVLGVEKQAIRRGDVLTGPGRLQTTKVLDARVELLQDISLPALKSRSLVHFHTGTTELTARIVLYDREELKPGDSCYSQFRFQEPLAVMTGDRYIVRRFSPLLTIGGGEILDPFPVRRKKKEGYDDLKVFEKGTLKEKLLMKVLLGGLGGTPRSFLEGWIKAELQDIAKAIHELVDEKRIVEVDHRLLHKDAFDQFSKKILSTVTDYHRKNPLSQGMPKENIRALFRWLEQRLFEGFLGLVQGIVTDRDTVRLESFTISLGRDSELLKDKILKALRDSAFQPPSKEELAKTVSVKNKELEELLKIMVSEGNLVRINDSTYLPSARYTQMINSLRDFFKAKPEMTVGEFRDILGTSRKYALPFLEYLDSNKITLRVGDVRKLLI